MILEGLVTTQNLEGQVNLAPMGPIVDASMTRLKLRPFQSSCTFRNLQVCPYGVFHVSDDVELIARAALDGLSTLPEMVPAKRVPGQILKDACRWYEFEVRAVDASQERVEIDVEVVQAGELRSFFGFHRARHAVLEATILATRLHIIPEPKVRAEFQRLQVPVEKTAGPVELAAWAYLVEYIDRWYAAHQPSDQRPRY